MTTKRFADVVRHGRALAIDPTAMFGMWEERERGTVERVGPCAIVRICGPLVARSYWFASYAEVREDFAAALATDATSVLLVIDSPGGEVAGLLDTVTAMRSAAEASGKRIVAFADSCAASAAFALACVATEIYLPSTGMVGSVGVMSQLLDLTANNALNGVRVETVTSGARKADGNPDVALSEDVIARERATVDKLAELLFESVSVGRGMSPVDLAALEAACFYGQDAVDVGLADGVATLDEVIAELAQGIKMSTTTTVEVTEEEETAEDMPAEEEAALPPSDGEGEEEDDGEEEAAKAAASAPVQRRAYTASRDVLALVREVTGEAAPKAQAASILAMRDELATARVALAKAKSEAAAAKAAARDAKVAAIVDKAIRAGKLTPAQKAWATDTGRTSLATLEAFLATAAPVARATPTAQPAVTPAATVAGAMTEADRRVARAMGLSDDAYQKTKADLLGSATH